MKVLIALNGKINNYSITKNAVDNFSPEYIICADGAYKHLKAIGLLPHKLVGDFDSITEDFINEANDLEIEVLKFPVEKDFIDGEVAIQEALKLKPEKILIIGGFGGRIDQTLANIHLLNILLENNVYGEIFDERGIMTLIDKDKEFTGVPGQIISLLPFGGTVEGITLEGLKYELNDAVLQYGDPYCVSNEFLGENAIVHLKKGKLLIVVQSL